MAEQIGPRRVEFLSCVACLYFTRANRMARATCSHPSHRLGWKVFGEAESAVAVPNWCPVLREREGKDG